MLHLLQYGVGLAAGVGIAGQHQQRQIIRRGRAAGSDHIRGAGADGGGRHHHLLALCLGGKGNGCLRHALLVLALIDLKVLSLLRQRLPQTHHIAVAGNDEQTLDETVLHAVYINELIFQKANQCLRHS